MSDGQHIKDCPFCGYSGKDMAWREKSGKVDLIEHPNTDCIMAGTRCNLGAWNTRRDPVVDRLNALVEEWQAFVDDDDHPYDAWDYVRAYTEALDELQEAISGDADRVHDSDCAIAVNVRHGCTCNDEFRGGCKPSSGTSCSASDGGGK